MTIAAAVALAYCPVLAHGSTHYSVSARTVSAPVAFGAGRYGNINPLSIHYPLRVRVRSRLTPG